MVDIPRTISTQHPDNATPPFFASGPVIEGEDEIQEAYYVYSHLNCEEQMWDFEGKEGDAYAVKKLLSRYDNYFESNVLGDSHRLTIRGPNPDVEKSEAKIILEILNSIPRSYDAAKLFYEDRGIDPIAPIFEVIIPMVTDATQLDLVHDYYQDLVVGQGSHTLADGRSVSDWVGDFAPDEISVIPLIEDRESMLAADEIVKQYVEGRDVTDQRVFLARSDPAMNYGSLAADLINKVALQRLYRMAMTTDLRIHPMYGAGSAPFRGNLAPHTAHDIAAAYPEVETFTIQSAFKYDYPVSEINDGIEALHSADLGRRPARIDEERALAVIDRTAEAYSRHVKTVEPLVNRLAESVPSRRSRKLHVGLFGYSREVGESSLPRAITFTATLYSIGFPPSIMGLSGLTDDDLDFIEDVFPQFFPNLERALQYYNPNALSVVDIPEEDVEAALDLVDVDPDPEHQEATDAVINSITDSGQRKLEDSIVDAARIRRFLG